MDRAKTFYAEKVGFNADHDHRFSDKVRFVQLTLRADLLDSYSLPSGVEISEVQEFDWSSFVFFSDLNRNGWA